MKILFVGRGVIGTQYAWAFEKAGHTVAFYVREGRKAHYKPYVDLEIQDMRRPKIERFVKERWPITLEEGLLENHDYDLIFMSVHPEQVKDVIATLAPKANRALFLFFSNFWQDPTLATSSFKKDQVVFGFPGAGGGFRGNTLHGALYKTVQFGSLEATPHKNDLLVRQLFKDTGFQISIQKDLRSWLHNHFALNVAMEVEVVKYGSFEKVISSSEALAGLGLSMRELVPIIRAKGSKVDLLSKVFSTLPPQSVGFLMKRLIYTQKSTFYTVTQHIQTKVGYAVKEVLEDAKAYGIKTPRLSAADQLSDLN